MINRKHLLTTVLSTFLALTMNITLGMADMDKTSQASLDTVKAFMGALGKGDIEAMSELMSEDMLWHNEGDKAMPWIGPWSGKDEILNFLGVFAENFQTTEWDNTDAFASGDTVAVFGLMNGVTSQSGKETGRFTFALRAKVKDGKLVLWNFIEDSFAVSQAFHGR